MHSFYLNFCDTLFSNAQFNNSPLCQITKYNNVLLEYYSLAKNLPSLVSHSEKLDNPYYHIKHKDAFAISISGMQNCQQNIDYRNSNKQTTRFFLPFPFRSRRYVYQLKHAYLFSILSKCFFLFICQYFFSKSLCCFLKHRANLCRFVSKVTQGMYLGF